MIAIRITLALAAIALPCAAQARTVAEDVADVSTRVCYAMAAGKLPQPANIEAEERLFLGLDLQQGLPNGALERMGEAGRMMISRATLASRTNGKHHVVLAAGGAVPGCRVLLVGEGSLADAALVEATAAAIGSRAFGWLALPAFTETRSGLERRLFIRFDESKQPYILNLMVLKIAQEGLQLFTSVAKAPQSAVPPGLVPKP